MGVLEYKEIKSKRDQLNISTVDIPESGAFFARFDCLHAGANYSDINIRVHFFLDPKRSSIEWRDVQKVYFSADVRTVQWHNYGNIYLTKIENCKRGRQKKSQAKFKKRESLKIVRAKKFKK